MNKYKNDILSFNNTDNNNNKSNQQNLFEFVRFLESNVKDDGNVLRLFGHFRSYYKMLDLETGEILDQEKNYVLAMSALRRPELRSLIILYNNSDLNITQLCKVLVSKEFDDEYKKNLVDETNNNTDDEEKGTEQNASASPALKKKKPTRRPRSGGK